MAARNGLHFWRLRDDLLLSKQDRFVTPGRDSVHRRFRFKRTTTPRFFRVSPVASADCR
jgi:hypothetical protein